MTKSQAAKKDTSKDADDDDDDDDEGLDTPAADDDIDNNTKLSSTDFNQLPDPNASSTQHQSQPQSKETHNTGTKEDGLTEKGLQIEQ
jgi:hypothetical protein